MGSSQRSPECVAVSKAKPTVLKALLVSTYIYIFYLLIVSLFVESCSFMVNKSEYGRGGTGAKCNAVTITGISSV